MLPIKISLPVDFLEEEVRNGFVVTKQMKEIWAVELDLLVEFMRVCQKHNIRWWMDGGSLLGTIRHKGFIPWDDDIDVIMMREDYQKLCQVASFEFFGKYFFQTELTDHGSMRGHAQLRNSATTAILKAEINQAFKFNQGIFLDIFPLDSIPEDDNTFSRQISKIIELKKKCLALQYEIEVEFCRKRKNFLVMWINKIRQKLFKSCLYYNCGIGRYYKEFEKTASLYSSQNTKYVGNLILGVFRDNWKWLREDYRDTSYMPFEFLSVPVPIGFESRLNIQYGDWRKIVRGTSLHGEVIFDVNKSYLEYVNQRKHICNHFSRRFWNPIWIKKAVP